MTLRRDDDIAELKELRERCAAREKRMREVAETLLAYANEYRDAGGEETEHDRFFRHLAAKLLEGLDAT